MVTCYYCHESLGGAKPPDAHYYKDDESEDAQGNRTVRCPHCGRFNVIPKSTMP